MRLLILVIAVIAFSCKDDDDPSPEQLLTTSNGWKITAYTFDPPLPASGGTTITDFYAQWDACEKDEVYLFDATGTYKVENSVKCDSNENSLSESGSWALSSDNKTLKFSPTDDELYEVTIASLRKTTLKVTTTDTYNDAKYVCTITFTAL